MRAIAVSFDTDLLFKQYRIAFHEKGDSRCSDQHSSLSSASDIRTLIDRMGEIVGSQEKRVAGSVFIKRYSALITGALYLWTHYGFAANLNRVTVHIDDSGLIFRLSKQPADRDGEFLYRLFADNACRVIDAVVSYTKVSEATLWANLSYLMAYRFREWIWNAKSDDLQESLHSIYHRIMNEPSADWFPEKSNIPLIRHFRSVEDPLQEKNRILIRNKCCLSYRLPGEDRYCYTCPLISDVCRIEKYKALHGSE